MESKKFKQLYFSHDLNPHSDKKIMKLIYTLGYEGYGLFWSVVEYMHRNEFLIEDEEILVFQMHADKDKLHSVLNDFGLFRKEDGKYISDRVLRNLEEMYSKSANSKDKANVRWLLSAFNKHYEEFFGEKPLLQAEEIEVLKKCSEQIPDFKNKIRDILYTLKNLKFSTDINFKPCANWLLKNNNLARLINGEFGELKHKKTAKEEKEERDKLKALEDEHNKPSELELEINQITNKKEALNLIVKHNPNPKKINGKSVLIPPLRLLTNKFAITERELAEYADRGYG